MKKNNRVLVAMSGGLDSSVTCMNLLKEGYEVEGITMRMWDTPSKFSTDNPDTPNYILEARELANRLGFPHHVMDIRDLFHEQIIQHFISEYLNGRTPNPCVLCNTHIKWELLLQKANELNCFWIATGHYANIEKKGDYFYVAKGKDPVKEQSYFLWGLGQHILSRAMMPLGNSFKPEIRAFAEDTGFKQIASKKESMEICFVEGDYRDFLKQQVPDIDIKIGNGNYIDCHGKIIGQHSGYPYYTIGQRKGLRIALGHPAYVTKINPAKNTVTLGEKEQLLKTDMIVTDYYLVNTDDFSQKRTVDTRIRYKSKTAPAVVEIIDDKTLHVQFCSPVEGITPGQSAVFYENERVLGGGFISQ